MFAVPSSCIFFLFSGKLQGKIKNKINSKISYKNVSMEYNLTVYWSYSDEIISSFPMKRVGGTLQS